MKRLLMLPVVWAIAISSVSAIQTADVRPERASLSVETHFITNGADADSWSVLAEAGVSDRTAIGFERIRISDSIGSITLGAFQIKEELYTNRDDDLYAAVYGGLRYLEGRSFREGNMNSDGLLLGAAAQKGLSPRVTAYGLLSSSFLDDTLTELAVSIGYSPRSCTEFSAGYKTYFINGESLGGFTAGATIRF